MTARTALILVGHGSHISPHTAGLVWRYVDRLRGMGIADEVTACFWKEQPAIAEALDTVSADDITIIPVFTAQGYFTQSVIPAELGITGAITQRGSRIVRYGRTPGEHPDLAGILQRRVTDTLQTHQLNAAEATVVLVGHGTKRNKDSRNATRQQVQGLVERQIVHNVIDAYLDDDPDIPSVYTRAVTPDLIVIPFFLAPGSHVTIDVPNALGLPENTAQAALNGKNVYYTDPIGTDETLCAMIRDLAHAAGMPEKHIKPSTWGGFPTAGAESLIRRVQQEREVIIGELRLTPACVQPLHDEKDIITLTTPQSLRQHVRENPFRTLASSRGLPQNWQILVSSADELPAIVETVYPGVTATLDAYQTNALKIIPLEETLARQQGNFRRLQALTPAQVNRTVESVCMNCIKHPLWLNHGETKERMIPCAEACNFWLSEALEAMV